MRRFFVLSILMASFVLSASAQKTISIEGADEVVRLWDNSTAKYSNYETRDEAFLNSKKSSIIQSSSCELYIFKAAQEKNTGIAVILYPGGGYFKLNFRVSMARWYASQGITCALVKYRLPHYGHYDATLEDATSALRYLRTRTDLGINPAMVGVSGSSAGGHLGAWVSNIMPDDEKPAFAVLLYPWIDLAVSTSSPERTALKELLGKGYKSKLIEKVTMYNLVTTTTSPTLLLLCDDDETVWPAGASMYYEALINHGVKASMHIFPFGGHSVSKHKAEYQPLILDWLKYLGLMEKK